MQASCRKESWWWTGRSTPAVSTALPGTWNTPWQNRPRTSWSWSWPAAPRPWNGSPSPSCSGTFTLEGNTVHHTLTVENPGSGPLQFGLGYHPAFVCPFDGDHDTRDYEFRFDKLESPLVLKTSAKGLLSGECGYFGTNLDSIPLTDRLFDHDSFCFGNLKSTTLGIYEKGSDRSVVCNIAPFPYTLIWSALSEKIHFVCIEPWHSLPGVEGGSSNWTDQAAAARLAPGESFTTTLSTTFNG